jgi:hypothetical protein
MRPILRPQKSYPLADVALVADADVDVVEAVDAAGDMGVAVEAAPEYTEPSRRTPKRRCMVGLWMQQSPLQ